MTTAVLMPPSLPRPSTPPEQTTSAQGLRLDLSGLPGLVEPSPPSNTLLITNLTNLDIFAPSALHEIRTHIESLIGRSELLYAFSPLKSLRRIIVTFTSTEPAITLRRELDGAELMGCRARLYFGEPTPIDNTTTHLRAPPSEKQFFISPPPSPPHGWTMRNEDPPNKDVHAADLVNALARLDARRHADEMTVDDHHSPTTVATPGSNHHADAEDVDMGEAGVRSLPRRKSSTTVVYHPDEHGGSPGLPAVLVVDVSEEGEPKVENERQILEHTARPPVELME